jgi:low temperature requirement protein LtrA
VVGGGPSKTSRLGTHLTIAAAIVLTGVGVGLMFNSGAETTWVDVAWMIVHALGIGVVVFVWLPLSAWMARRLRLAGAVTEGLMVLVLGLLVAGVEFGLLRGSDRVAQTVVAVVGMLAGWAMRIEPPEPASPGKRAPRKRR